ncbi:Similar to STX10: Syntaxin-10 (Homo sapiens) [Cotesia congregata]|uniref:Similar to STX10: Syntaxin-10 (Homo sapiens) n=1 Tax=Cotesia congregata TaxID=51543 RepID=A0A8J2HAK8_COTCN|nr:Similar to STX10: Syntaxin-10 (Homo sapiens) [Cotesia congregata]
MTLEDPFFVVKESLQIDTASSVIILSYIEVCKALNKTRGLYGRWTDSQSNVTVVTPNGVGPGGLPVSKEELEWTTTELRNALRS